ncbi:hypothetical protein Stsp01_49730 [Streptomyces sp. NBRC 13847]|nr:hypothetical protein Stsp01_49730 [Streptomyces sp. NBRC 13847]
MEDLDGPADVERLDTVEEDHEDLALFHASILATVADGSNDGFPTFPATIGREAEGAAGSDPPGTCSIPTGR